MKSALAIRNTMIVAALLPLAACSGGSNSVPHASSVAPASGGSASKGGSAKSTVKARLFIPTRSKTFASALRLGSSGSTRKPDYVSYSTNGVAITSNDPTSGNVIDSVAFSTNSSDNSNCVDMAGGTACSFTIGAESPNTTFNVSAYDTEPSPATGGPATDEPSSAALLSTGTLADAAIITGAANPIDIALGGVVQALSFTSASNTNVTGASSVLSVPGTSLASVTFGYIAYDAGGNMIAAGANDPLANPVDVSLNETNANPAAPSSTLTMNGGPGATSLTSSNTSDTFTLSYDGSGTGTSADTAYEASVVAKSGSAADAVSGTLVANSAEASLVLSPIFLAATTQPNDVFKAAIGSTPASLAYFTPASSGAYTTVSIVSAVPIPSPSYGATLDASNACTGFSFPQDAAGGGVFDAEQSSPTNASPCDVVFTDGQSNLQLNVSATTTGSGGITVPKKAGIITFDPPSPFTASKYALTYLTFTSSDANPTYSIVSCQAPADSGCYVETSTFDNYCINESGYIGVQGLQPSGTPIIVAGTGDISDDTQDPNSKNTGDIVGCVLTISDGTNTATYSLTNYLGSSSASVHRVVAPAGKTILGMPRAQ